MAGHISGRACGSHSELIVYRSFHQHPRNWSENKSSLIRRICLRKEEPYNFPTNVKYHDRLIWRMMFWANICPSINILLNYLVITSVLFMGVISSQIGCIFSPCKVLWGVLKVFYFVLISSSLMNSLQRGSGRRILERVWVSETSFSHPFTTQEKAHL